MDSAMLLSYDCLLKQISCTNQYTVNYNCTKKKKGNYKNVAVGGGCGGGGEKGKIVRAHDTQTCTIVEVPFY
jgi:hypothetical protein